MRYIPASDQEISDMLKAIGLESTDQLFRSIPENLRFHRSLCVPPAMSEWALNRHMRSLAERSEGHRFTSFLGGGVYAHHAPAAIDTLISRSEFSTAYTPYQPEISQGTLQAIFEFQTYVCELFGMEVANASLYEAASGLAEACLMAERVQKKKPRKILISRALNPHYRQTILTYLGATGIEVVELPWTATGGLDLARLETELAAGALGLVVQSPNYFGVVEDLQAIGTQAQASGSFFVVGVSEPVSMGLLAPPGQFGADVVVAEGQTFGLPLSFGGPYAGMFATRMKHVRAMPGRVVGMTSDADGRRGFVLTLSTREQHIRREKATSNICTNQGLYALVATIYLSLIGREGLRTLARHNLSQATWLKRALAEVPGVETVFSGPTFNEFLIRSKHCTADTLLRRLEAHGILGGITLEETYPELGAAILVTATEAVSREDMVRLVDLVKKEARA